MINPLIIIILIALVADAALHFIADRLNLERLETGVPDPFKGWYDTERYAKSQEYLKTNTRFKWFVSGVYTAVFLVFWFGGGFPWLDGWTRCLVVSPILRGLIFIGGLYAFRSILSFPFSAYATFVIEERFGFNRSTWGVFISDSIKKFLLTILLGGVLLAGIMAFFKYAGVHAWLYCWGGVTVFMVIMQYVVPTWIMPLFNKFKPLEPGPLKSAILSYAGQIRFPIENVLVMDGSRRSKKSNAFFTGFGRHRRIVLFDTLIENHTTDELVAILAHEMGHYRKRHVHQMLLGGILQTGILLYLLSFFITSPMLSDAFFMNQPSVYGGLVFFGILYSPIDFIIGIVFQMVSRRNEYAADRFAVQTTGNAGAFSSALKKLAAHNLSNLTPHPFYVFLNYSHPPLLSRLAAIQEAGAGISAPRH